LLLAAGSGLLCFLAFPPVQWHWLGWIALWPLLVAVRGARSRDAVLCGLLTTFCFYGLSIYWVFSIMRDYGRLSVPMAAAVLLLLLFYASLYRVAFCWVLAWISRRNGAMASLAAPFLWVAMEFSFVRTPHFSFPWNLLGYAATHELGILQMASVTGVYGISFLMAGFAALAACWPRAIELAGRKLPVASALGGMMVALVAARLAGAWLLPAAPARYTARLVQMNIAQSLTYTNDWIDQHAAELDEIERLSASAAPHPALLVWPEVPAPFYLQDPRFGDRAQRIARGNGGNFLVGVVEWRVGSGRPERDEPGRPYPRNSAVLLGPAGERISTYDKIHLVPFGEYVPLREWLRFADSLVAEVGGFVPGRERVVAQTPQGKFASLICFEAVFPNEVRQFVAAGAELLVNISNDGWLGATAGPAQHMEMARMRAVENRRWLLRATNTGLTVAIDPYGRIVAQIPAGRRAVLDAPFDFRNDLSVYTRWGDWFAWLCVAVSGMLIVLAGKKKSEVRGQK